MDANASSGRPGKAGGDAGFSRNASTRCPSSWTTPNDAADARGTGIAATVTPAPRARCASIICAGSIRYTSSAPNTTTRSGRSLRMRFSDW